MRIAVPRAWSLVALTAVMVGLLGASGVLLTEASPPSKKAGPEDVLELLEPKPFVAAPLGTEPLEWEEDIAAKMVAGIERWLDMEIEQTLAGRAPKTWPPETRANKREVLTALLGLVEMRQPPESWELIHTLESPVAVARTEKYTVQSVRWSVLSGLDGEGLLLLPKGAEPKACVVVIPDADQTPEQWVGLADGLPAESQVARRLAEQGVLVLVPTLINRDGTHSGSAKLNIWTNQSHRAFLHRAAFEMGRTLTGLEVQKVLAAVDRFEHRYPETPVGVFGYGEGGLLALHAGALDRRIAATVVSGHFGANDAPWEQPLYRNVWRLLRGFSDLELAELVSVRPLIVELARGPDVSGPPQAVAGRRKCAAPGRLDPEAPAKYRGDKLAESFQLVGYKSTSPAKDGQPGSTETLRALLDALRVAADLNNASLTKPTDERGQPDQAKATSDRHRRQFVQLLEFTQRLLRESESARDAYKRDADTRAAEARADRLTTYRTRLWEDIIGKLPAEDANWLRFRPRGPPRSRLIYDQPRWTGYEVVLDVRPRSLFAYGILLLPKDLKPGERRPVVVCQHGLEGRPSDLCGVQVPDRARGAYADFAAKLAERGFVVYAPQNPYIGGDKFRILQRKANVLGLSLFSFIIEQHAAHLKWLASQPFVDAERIGFYGLSYGGKTAMRVPAVLPDYALSICSGDFNEWIHKNVSVDLPMSYMFTGEYEMPEWNLGNTFNYAEMASLICPRPFLVERGHDDGVGLDTWVAYEYAKVRRHYVRLGQAEKTEIEFFDGGHRINGQASFRFLHRWLKWPEPKP